MGADRPPRRDPGLQPERTCLAASRAALAALVAALLCLRMSEATGFALALAASLAAGGAGAIFLAVALRLASRPAHGRAIGAPSRHIRWLFRGAAVAVASTALLEAISILLGETG